MMKDTFQRDFVVSLHGRIWFDTTVAVIADTEEEAAERALQGAHWDPSDWRNSNHFYEDPTVQWVEEDADRSELEFADQKHLLPGSEEGTRTGMK